MQCFTHKQTCNGEYTKHCTQSRNQLKLAAEVSKKRSNFRIRQFKEKRHFNIATNLTLNMMASFITLLIARTARIACADRHPYIHTYISGWSLYAFFGGLDYASSKENCLVELVIQYLKLALQAAVKHFKQLATQNPFTHFYICMITARGSSCICVPFCYTLLTRQTCQCECE